MPPVGYMDGYSTIFEEGESSIYAQYKLQIQRAERYIYIENQHICDEDILQEIINALDRYCCVCLLMYLVVLKFII